MTREDIIEMARHADREWDCDRDMLEWVETFAALVAAAEREACCGIVYGQCGSDNVAQRTVDAIRARGEK